MARPWYNVQCILFTVCNCQCCTVSTMHTISCIMDTVNFTIYSNTVPCTLYKITMSIRKECVWHSRLPKGQMTLRQWFCFCWKAGFKILLEWFLWYILIKNIRKILTFSLFKNQIWPPCCSLFLVILEMLGVCPLILLFLEIKLSSQRSRPLF